MDNDIKEFEEYQAFKRAKGQTPQYPLYPETRQYQDPRQAADNTNPVHWPQPPRYIEPSNVTAEFLSRQPPVYQYAPIPPPPAPSKQYQPRPELEPELKKAIDGNMHFFEQINKKAAAVEVVKWLKVLKILALASIIAVPVCFILGQFNLLVGGVAAAGFVVYVAFNFKSAVSELNRLENLYNIK